MKTMDSFLQNYLSGKSIGLSLDEFLKKEPFHQLALAMKELHLANSNGFKFENAIELVKQIDYKKYEVEEQLVFLQLLAHAYCVNDRINNAYSIMSITKRLITSQLSPEFQIIPIDIEAVIHFKNSDFKKQLENFEKCMQLLKNRLGKFKVYLGAYLIQISTIHNRELFEKNLSYLKTLGEDDHTTQYINFLNMLKSVEDANFGIIEALAKQIKTNKSFLFLNADITYCEKIARVITHNDIRNLDENNEQNWETISLYNLFNNKCIEALHWARKYADVNLDYTSKTRFLSYSLIRAELAYGNVNAAEYSLNKRKEIENTSIFDVFFWFRIHNIKKDKKLAQEYYNIFCDKVEKENLEVRFDLELKLSPEISFTTIREYSENRKIRISKKNIPLQDLAHNKHPADLIIGKSPLIIQVKALIKKFAEVESSVLIYGETGTGKELIAKALWQSGPYKDKPFIAINCGAISEHLLQSELFGHNKGAFTGAFNDHKGIFEAAEDGIVFMDEIGEINMNMQINLLRTLEAREFRPVGSNTTKKLNCKIIAATNQKIETLVKNGTFREDLQYRLEKLIIEVPPLRDRPSDIPELIEYFLNEINPNLPKIYFDKQTLSHLSSLPWKGNIRELRNEMERIRLFYSDKNKLTINEISDKYKNQTLDIIKFKPEISQEQLPLNVNAKFRKLENLKMLFQKYHELSRTDVANLLDISSNTASNYLNSLVENGYIIKSYPTKSKSTFIYKINI